MKLHRHRKDLADGIQTKQRYMSVGQKWSGKNSHKSGRPGRRAKIQLLGLYKTHILPENTFAE